MPKTPEERRAARCISAHTYYVRHKDKIKRKAEESYTTQKDKIIRRVSLYRRTHKAEIAASNRAYRAAHKEEIAAQKRAYRTAHIATIGVQKRAYNAAHAAQGLARNAARRARQRGVLINDLSAAQWEEIKAAYGHRCVYCGRNMQQLTKDHITPLGPEGPHTFTNVVPACRSCNSKKLTGPPLCPVQPLLLTIAPAIKKRRKR